MMTCVAPQTGAAQQTEANVMMEIPFREGRLHVEPFKDVVLDVVCTDPEGTQRNVLSPEDCVLVLERVKSSWTFVFGEHP